MSNPVIKEERAMSGDLKILAHEKLSGMVYSALCDAITQGKFQSGDRLKIREIAEKLGTSVTPVRDAILRLAHDDAIEFRSARDIRIPELTQARYLEIRSIRIKLEGLAAETAAQLATPRDLSDLEKILTENETAIAAGDAILGSELNQAFHFQLMTIARMPILRGMLQRVWLQMGPVISEVYLEGGRSMIDHHYSVLDALRNKDADAAARAIMDDILVGGTIIAERVAQRRRTA